MTKSLRRSAINSCWVPVYRLPRVDSFLIYGLDEYPAGQRGIIQVCFNEQENKKNTLLLLLFKLR